MKNAQLQRLNDPHRIYIDKWYCSNCDIELSLNSPEIKNRHHVPKDKRVICNRQVRLVKRYCGQTQGLGIREILNMDIREFLNTEIVLEDGYIYIRKSD